MSMRVREHPIEVDTVFKIAANYYTNIVYNDLYIRAKDTYSREQRLALTECYGLAISQYVTAIKKSSNDFLRHSINGLRGLFDEHTKFNFITLDDCFVSITNAFMPPGFGTVVDRARMQSIIYNCLVNAISGACGEIATSYIGSIIDDHMNVENVRQINNLFYEYFALEREKMISRCVSSKTKEGIQPVDADLLHRMRETNAKLERHLDSQTEKAKKYKAQIIELQNKVITLEDGIAAQYKLQNELVQTNEDYKKKLLRLIEEIRVLREFRSAVPEQTSRQNLEFTIDTRNANTPQRSAPSQRSEIANPMLMAPPPSPHIRKRRSPIDMTSDDGIGDGVDDDANDDADDANDDASDGNVGSVGDANDEVDVNGNSGAVSSNFFDLE